MSSWHSGSCWCKQACVLTYSVHTHQSCVISSSYGTGMSTAYLTEKFIVKSMPMNSAYCPMYKATLTIPYLHNLVAACDAMTHGIVCKAAYLQAFFAFLRLSNVAPTSAAVFDNLRHIFRRDIVFGYPEAHLILKWGKVIIDCASILLLSSCHSDPLPSPLLPLPC